jgi:hypothetical protein
MGSTTNKPAHAMPIDAFTPVSAILNPKRIAVFAVFIPAAIIVLSKTNSREACRYSNQQAHITLNSKKLAAITLQPSQPKKNVRMQYPKLNKTGKSIFNPNLIDIVNNIQMINKEYRI